jgi:hypothetical protein
VQAAAGTYQVRQAATLNVQVSLPAGQVLFGPDKNEKYYYGGGVSLYTSEGVLVSGPVMPDETGAATIVTPTLADGNNTFYAAYSGNFYVLPSKSKAVEITAGTAIAASDFQIEGPSTIQVAGNANATVALQIVPVNGFNQTIKLSCTGLPAGESCSLPANVTPTSATDVVLTIASTNTALVAGFPGCFILLFATRRKQRLFAALLLIPAAVLVSGCLGKSMGVISANAGSQTYPVTIKATSGTITHQLVVSVTIDR